MVAFILVCLVLLLGLLWGWEIRKRKSLEQEFVKKKNEVCSVKEFSDTILYNVDAYIILVDRNFLVEKTNYYNLNNTSEGQVLRRVGELLRCKNGLDAGACGSHENCKVCPVRNSIEKCFREKGHFSPLETPMRLYMSEKMDNYVDCIVCVSGTYLQLDQDDKVLLTVRDVTRQKKILDELEEARRNAEWAGEQKTAFLANMSHKIRTPLNAIVGFAGLLGTASDQDRISYVEIIKGNTNMLLQLVNDILDMSKIEAGTLEFIYTDVDVNQIMRELEGIFRLRLEEADVPVRIIFEPKLPVCFIHTEKNRISQVISNFLSNAFKYTVQGSISMGSPAGMVHSSSYGFISYIAKNVQMTDGNARVLYADIKSKADAGTFLFNTEGELVGWATDRYEQDVDTGMKTFMSISDYKGALELLSNGIQVPYLGIEGQEVTSEMEKNGMPSGIYMIAAAAESPAYNAGLQPGDILSGINDIKIEGMKNFQAQVEKLHVGDRITVTVQRNNGKDEYKEIEFEVTVGAR